MSKNKPDRDALLTGLLGTLVRQVADRGRARVGRQLRNTRHQLEVRQLKRDREHFWIRLGKTAYRLVEAGEIEHSALQKAIERIQAIDRQIEELEAQPEDVAEPGSDPPG
jgi:hypothetical protein